MDFLFISKILPLFLYPLGLISLLLSLALFLAWKRPRWTPIPTALALLILLISSNGWFSNALVKSLEWRYLPSPDLPNADAIVLLGGATKSGTFPRPMVDVNEEGDRVLYAAKLYQDGKAPLIVASGGRIDWFSSGKPESADMAQLLQMMGVPAEVILQDPSSLNTYQNAVNVRQILQQKGIQRVLLVTSALHMPRSLLIFKHQGIDVIPAPTDFLVSQQDQQEPSSSFQASLLNTLPDAERLAKTTKAIKEYIGTFIYRLRGWL